MPVSPGYKLEGENKGMVTSNSRKEEQTSNTRSASTNERAWTPVEQSLSSGQPSISRNTQGKLSASKVPLRARAVLWKGDTLQTLQVVLIPTRITTPQSPRATEYIVYLSILHCARHGSLLITGANVCSYGESEGELSYSCHLLVKTKMFFFFSKLETKLATENFWHTNAHLLCGAHLRKAAGSFCATRAH